MNTPEPLAPIKAHCPKCGLNRLADVVAHLRRREENEEVWGETDYRILQCRGCEAVFFQTDSIFSEDWDYRTDPHTGEEEPYLPHNIRYWPEPSPAARTRPPWTSCELERIDEDLASLLNESYSALDQQLLVLSAIGIRTVFDRASELLNVDPAKTFAEKLSELVQLGKIGPDEKDNLDILTDAGNAAAHRGWRPKPEELDTMMNIIETFLYRTFILNAAAKQLKQNVPTRQKRNKALG